MLLEQLALLFRAVVVFLLQMLEAGGNYPSLVELVWTRNKQEELT